MLRPWRSIRRPTTRSARNGLNSSRRRPGYRSTMSRVEAMREGRLRWEDLRATRRTLRAQAALRRPRAACRLPTILPGLRSFPPSPPETILEIYTALRPHRSTNAELEGWAARLDDAGAPLTADFVREAAAVYAKRGLLGRSARVDLGVSRSASARASQRAPHRAVSRARARGHGRSERSRSPASSSRTAVSSRSTAGAKRHSTSSTGSSHCAGSISKLRREAAELDDSQSRAGSSTWTVRVRSSSGSAGA